MWDLYYKHIDNCHFEWNNKPQSIFTSHDVGDNPESPRGLHGKSIVLGRAGGQTIQSVLGGGWVVFDFNTKGHVGLYFLSVALEARMLPKDMKMQHAAKSNACSASSQEVWATALPTKSGWKVGADWPSRRNAKHCLAKNKFFIYINGGCFWSLIFSHVCAYFCIDFIIKFLWMLI